MLEVYEVFDASDEELLAELQGLQQQLATASGASYVQAKLLYDTVRQELDERGLSNKVFQRLGAAADAAHTPQQLSSQLSMASSLGLASPAAFAAPLPSAMLGQQAAQPVAMLYSFGSFGAGGGNGTASGAGAYGHHPYLGAGQALSPGANGANSSSITHAVNAMAAASARQQLPLHQGQAAALTGGVAATADRGYYASFQVAPALSSFAPVAGKQQAHPPQVLQVVHAASPVPQPQHPQPQTAPQRLAVAQKDTSHSTYGQAAAATQPASPGPSLPAETPRHCASGAGNAIGGDGPTLLRHEPSCGSDAAPISPLPASANGTASGEQPLSPAGEGSSLSGAGSSGAVGAEGPGGAAADGSAGAGGGKALTPWEAAMLAFREEQRLLQKARKAIKKGPPPKANAKKPVAAAQQPLSARPAALAPESSQGSTRSAGGKPGRPSVCGSVSSAAAPYANGSAPQKHVHALQPGPGSGDSTGAASPHGAVALAAGSAVVGGNRAAGRPAKASSAPPRGMRQTEAAASGVAANKAAVPRPATADALAGTAAAGRPVSPPMEAWADAEPIAEEQGLAGVQAEAAEVAVSQREPSEPESVKTDEESSEVLASAMREAAAANAAAGASGRGTGASDSSDSEPESVPSDDPEVPESQQAEGARLFQMTDGPMGRNQEPGDAAGPGPRMRTLSASQLSASERQQRSSAAQRPSESIRNGGARPTPSGDSHAGIAVRHDPVTLADVADTVATESESDSDGASISGDGPGGLGLPGWKGEGAMQRGTPHSAGDPQQDEEARRRAIAAAAAAAIQGRSAADPSSAMLTSSGPHLARAVVHAGPMRVDRWADWELADSSDALSAWATNHEEDPMRGGHLRGMVRPVGQHAPPESLVTGPTGAHGVTASLLQQGRQQHPEQQQLQQQQAAASRTPEPGPAGGCGGGGVGGGGGESSSGCGYGASRFIPRSGVDSPVRVGTASSGSGRVTPTGRAGRGAADGCDGAGSSSDGGAGSDAGGSADAGRRGHSAGPARALTPSPPTLPRAGMVPAGSTPGALASTAAGGTTSAGSTAGAAPRRPPLPPGQAQPQRALQASPTPSGERLPSATSSASLPRSASPSGSAAETTNGTPQPGAPPASAAYLQHYSAFHDILTVCYSSLPVMLDAAALSSSSLAVVVGSNGGGGGSGSRPPSRMVPPSAGAVTGIDLLERYASLLARCEAWQAKLRQLTQGSPYDGVQGLGGETNGAVEPGKPIPAPVTSATVPAAPQPPVAVSSRSPSARPTGEGGSQSSNVALAVLQPPASPPPPQPPPQPTRYVAIVDDTAHPEVRNVVNAALQLLSPAWTLDPADQVTEVAKPETSPDDDPTAPAASSSGSRPPTATPAGMASSCSSRAVSAGGSRPAGSAATPPPGGGPGGGSGGAGGGGGGSGGGGGGVRCHMWNVLWSWSVKVRVPAQELMVWQRVNHFAEARQLTRKDLLKKHLAKYQAMHNTGRSAALFDRLCPTTFVLPKEAAAFEEAFVRALHGVEPTCVQPMGLNLWIQKPVGLSRGRGISLISSMRKVNTAEPMIVQRYLTEPLLVEGFKFDLRLYVLVTSFNPLEAWMYEEGFARFTTLPYTLDESELGNMHVHLTNSSVQRSRAEAGELPSFLQSTEPAGGSKTSLATLRKLLGRQGVDWATLWGRVCEVATAALFAAQDAIPHSPNSFELFGFDMMIDAQQKVWLLEVNSSPSMGLDTPLDRAVKPRLIADVLELLAPLPFDRQALATVLRTRTSTGRNSRRGAQGLLSGTVSEERELCGADLHAVLGGVMPRRYGERPRNPGGFTTCLAPSPFHDRLLKLRRPLP